MTVDDRTGQVTLPCPECGTRVTISSGQRSANDFCPTCDFPMFWARASDAPPSLADDGDSTRRSPGVYGARQSARIACGACFEPNAPEALVCLRCGASMLVSIVPQPIVPEPQPPVTVVEHVVCGHRPTWQIVLLTASISVLATSLMTALIWWLSS